MVEEKQELDLKKIEEAAFSAIDELFAEDVTPEVDSHILKLEEAILSLDWEFSKKELSKIMEVINELKSVYTDKLNEVLLNMMQSIAKFLVASKGSAPPDTITILGQIVKTFKEINTLEFSDVEKKKKVKQAYEAFAKLREKLAQIKKAKADKIPSSEERPEEKIEAAIETKAEEDKVISEKEEKKEDILETGTEEQLTISEATIPQSATISEPILGVEFREIKDTVGNLKKLIQEMNMNWRLQFKELSNSIQKFAKDVEELKQKLSQISEIRQDIDLLKTLLAKERLAEAKVDTKKAIPETKDTVLSKSLQFKEGDREPSEQPTLNEGQLEDTNSLEWLYVYLFQFGDKLLAIPLENIANVYSISDKKAKKLLLKEKILLKELKSFWGGKLSKNIKGHLKGIKEKDLEKLEASVIRLPIDAKGVKYASAILITTAEDKFGVLFAGKLISKKPYLPTSGNVLKTEAKEIAAQLDTPKGLALLINPGELL